MINITLINGGRGAKNLIPELLLRKKYNITSIVNAYDDGKSTGALRYFFDVLGPSDIRKVQRLFLHKNNFFYKDYLNLFDYRFPKKISNLNAKIQIDNLLTKNINIINSQTNKIFLSSIKEILFFLKFFKKILIQKEKKKNKKFNFNDCSVMNCIYVGAMLYYKNDINKTILKIKKIFNLEGNVVVNSNEIKYLCGIRSSGKVLYSESEIVEQRSNAEVLKIFLIDSPLKSKSIDMLSKKKKIEYLETINSQISISKECKKTLKNSKLIIYCPGTQHSSLYPTYMTKSFSNYIIDNSNAFKVLITNIGADYETPKFKDVDYVEGAFKYLSMNSQKNLLYKDLFNLVIINKPRLKNDSKYVKNEVKKIKSIKVNKVLKNFEDTINLGNHNFKLILDTIENIK